MWEEEVRVEAIVEPNICLRIFDWALDFFDTFLEPSLEDFLDFFFWRPVPPAVEDEVEDRPFISDHKSSTFDLLVSLMPWGFSWTREVVFISSSSEVGSRT